VIQIIFEANSNFDSVKYTALIQDHSHKATLFHTNLGCKEANIIYNIKRSAKLMFS